MARKVLRRRRKRRRRKYVPRKENLSGYQKTMSKLSGLPLQPNVFLTLRSSLFSSSGQQRKTVRFSDANSYSSTPISPSDEVSPSEVLFQQQQIMHDQDESLDRLSESIGRQRELSIQIGDELDEQNGLIDDVGQMVDRTSGRLSGARKRLDRIGRKAKENGMCSPRVFLRLC